jgi:exopolysaccharide biosynthesis polyprenyl glycosylphosphotransferase
MPAAEQFDSNERDGAIAGKDRRSMATIKGTEPSITMRSVACVPSSNGHSMAPPLSQVHSQSSILTKHVPYAVAKRALDIVVSSIVLVVFSWLFLLLAALVKITSRGPAIFKQERVGVGGKSFICYKFRSMCIDAEERKDKLSHLNEASGPVFKIKDDPRVTPIGKFIRKLSLDELPQFLNVLRGEMSLVGPRPPVPCEVEHYSARDQRRLSVKPGLTCLWQINGRSNVSFDHWMELDLLYIDTMSFMGDLAILVKTIPAVFTGRGAH